MVDDCKRNTSASTLWWLWRIARLPLLAYCFVLLLAVLFEERLIFFPLKFPYGDWNPVGLTIEDAHFTAADGTKLHGWHVPHNEPLAHVLFLHGNAGNVTDRIGALHALHGIGVSVLILDYRGYGKSDGMPNEHGVLQDARAARKWLAETAGIAEAEVVVLGRSLGGGVAVDLTTDVPPKALILENTFTSMPDVAAIHYPFLPVRTLMSTRLDSLGKIRGYDGPLFQVHGTADEVIPLALGKQLFEAASGEYKQFIELPGGRHNDLLPNSYYLRLREFLAGI